MTDDLVREHVLAVLRDSAKWHDAILAECHRLENEGYRLVTGGQIDGERWEIKDARTGAVLASRGDGMEGYGRAAEKLESAQPIFDTSHIWNDVDHPCSAEKTRLSRLLPQLARVINEWNIETEDPDAIGAWLGEEARELAIRARAELP
jgi:hypothetical protein